MTGNDIDRTELTRAALDAAKRGWHVFPLRPDDKRPAFPNHAADRCDQTDPRCRTAGTHVGWQARATTDPDRIRRAWSMAAYNIGIACGPSGLAVLDLDTPKPGQTAPVGWNLPGVVDGGDVLTVLCERAGQPLPLDTYTVTTGRGGSHLYYRAPTDMPGLRNTTGALGWLIDTRADGGYVVGAGSTVNGRPYAVAHPATPTPLPVWLAEALAPPPARPVGAVSIDVATNRRDAYVRAALIQSGYAVRGSGPDRHNAALFGAASSLGELVAGGALPEKTVFAVLLPAALDVGQPEAEALRTIRSGLRNGARRPRSVAA